MRKYLFPILAVILLSVGLARAASERDNTNVGVGVIGTTDRGVTYDTSFKKIFSTEGSFGQDLYENIHQRVKNEGNDKAAERVLADRSISLEELAAIIPGANTLQLMAKPDLNTEIDYLTIEARRKELEKAFMDAKDLADLEAMATMEVEATEIFANGDESDSGFDLITDLDVIETILFGTVVSAPSGAGDTPGSDVIDLAEGDDSGGSPRRLSRAETKRILSGEPVPEAATEEAEPAAPVEVVEPTPTPEEAAAVCPLDASFNSAVVAARSQERAENGGVNPSGTAGAAAASKKGRSGNGAGNGNTGGAGESSGEEQPLVPETPGDYSSVLPCGKVFCLKIEKIYKTESSYMDTDNCIACHFEKINDYMRKTLDHNLVPSKATGNLMEAPKCKRSVFNLKQNFILIPQPIVTPPGDDLIMKGDMLKNLVDFWNAYKPFGCGTETNGNLVCKPQRDLTAQAAERVFQQMQEGSTPDKVMQDIRSQVDAEAAAAANVMKAHSLISDAKNQASQYSVLMQEMDVMSGYFESFLALYNQLTSGGGESPCETFLTKETCH